MAHKFSCFICKKEVHRSNKKAHLFSGFHSQDIWNALLKKKEPMSLWIKSVEEGKRPLIIPSVFFSGNPGRCYKVCLACNTIEPSTDKFLVCSCGGAAQNALAIKNILATKTFKENPLYQKSVACEATSGTQTDCSGGDTQTLLAENSKLKKKISLCESMMDELEFKAEKGQLLMETLVYSLQYLKQEDISLFQNIMSNIQEDYIGVLDYLPKNLIAQQPKT